MITIGYGDEVPRTLPGKLVGAVCILSSLLILSFPITIIGANLSEVSEVLCS
jgi:hypothetical protein